MSELTIEREFAASPETVFAFVTQSEHLVKWWGPESMTLPEHALDLTREGPWSSVMMTAEGNRFKVIGMVTKVSPPNAVEFTWAWCDENDVRGHESRVRFTVEPNGSGGSRFTLHHTGLADDESANSHNEGWASSLCKLERMAAS